MEEATSCYSACEPPENTKTNSIMIELLSRKMKRLLKSRMLGLSWQEKQASIELENELTESNYAASQVMDQESF